MLGDKIKELRISNNYTQDDLAKKLKISKSTIGMYEQNRRSPDLDTLLKISDIFNVSTDYLLGKIPYVNDKATFGDRLKYFLNSNDYDEFCDTIGISKKLLSKWFNNTDTSYMKYLDKIQNALNIPINLLLDDTIPPNSSIDFSMQELNLINYFRELKNNRLFTEQDLEPITKYFPNAHILTDEESEIIDYYRHLSLRDKRWVMGQMVDLIKKSEADSNSVSSQKVAQ